jgi:hypothetical protein
VESKCFKKMEALEVAIKKHNINLDSSSSTSSSHGHALSALNKFPSYCIAQGIQMQHTVPYTPQQNGVVERKNHTLKEMANCMIPSKGLSLNYWAQTINCANYIVNRTPPKALKNITPEAAWTKIKPDVSHFRVYGSVAWAHIPNEKRKALQSKSPDTRHVGHENTSILNGQGDP